jgi:3-methyladenine DNA glycosylase AlkC
MAGLSKENPLKNAFNERVIKLLAAEIKKNYKAFKADEFFNETMGKFPTLGFLERSKHIRDMLYKYLPAEYPKAAEILIKSLGPELGDDELGTFDGFVVMSQCDFVSTYGKNHFDNSMKALYELTKRFSAEGDLRTFLEVDYAKAMKMLHEWCNDPNPHIRRLVSEGIRPRLPLAGRIKRFQKDPKPVIELLDKLKDDSSLYVRRSVANNINDIAKDNPEIAIETLKRWYNSKSKNVQWVVRHASRSLLKSGNKDVLSFLGYPSNSAITVTPVIADNDYYSTGDKMLISFSISSDEKTKVKLMVDYVINYVKANGKGADKVFKMRDIVIDPGQKINIEKAHWLRDTSGRKHFPGEHSISLQINGVRYPNTKFKIK